MSNLSLFGLPRSGKSYWSRLLAKSLGKTPIETDSLLEELYSKQAGEKLSCSEIYRKVGKRAFREMEQEVIDSLNPKGEIISLGGGTILSPESEKKLARIGSLVYLVMEKEWWKKQMETPPFPAYLDSSNLDESLENLYQTRVSQYEKIPAYPLLLAGKSDEEILSTLKRLYYGE